MYYEYDSHFTDEVNEAQRRLVTCLMVQIVGEFI